MRSNQPTGIGIAGDAIAELLPSGVARTSPRLDRWFAAVNDGPLPGALRAVARLLLAQVAPWFFSRDVRLIFASHHAPLWRTGRHAVVLYDTIPLQFPEQAPVQTAYYRRCLPRIARCAERLVTISAAVRDEFMACGIESARTAAVIPAWSAGVAPRVSTGPRLARELLVVGARYPHKNIDVVLAALDLLNRESPDPWRLTIAGCDRALWGRAWGGLDYFERRGWVRTIERAKQEELSALYSRSTALVYPSLSEGQGLPPLEAMAAGCAALCSDLPVLRETCGEAALYFPAHDARALAQLVANRLLTGSAEADLRRTTIARTQLERFGHAALAARWKEFLEAWV